MKTVLLSAILIGSCSPALFAQQAGARTSVQGRSETAAATEARNRNISVQSGTRLSGELQNTIDVRKARVGDQVLLKTTHAIKSEGRTVVGKGARLLGHVTSVTEKSKSDGNSSISILFDTINSGSLEIPITATIISVARAAATTRVDDDAQLRSEMPANRTTQSGRSGGGGLIGGVSNTVNEAVNSTTGTVGTVVAGTTSAMGSTGLDRTLRDIQISESSNTSVDGSSTLSLSGNNLKLEKGTTFNLVLSQSATARSPNQD